MFVQKLRIKKQCKAGIEKRSVSQKAAVLRTKRKYTMNDYKTN